MTAMALVTALVSSAALRRVNCATAGRKWGTITAMTLAAASLAVLFVEAQVRFAAAQACAVGNTRAPRPASTALPASSRLLWAPLGLPPATAALLAVVCRTVHVCRTVPVSGNACAETLWTSNSIVQFKTSWM
jgi:hypothetical protein